MEAVIAVAVLIQQFDFKLSPNQTIGMTTGATIHTTNGLYMDVTTRAKKQQQAITNKQPVTAAARGSLT